MFNGLEHKLTSARARNASLKKSALKINKETAVQGIIFSEVLGPPRAKKPHRTMRNIGKNKVLEPFSNHTYEMKGVLLWGKERIV